MGCEQPEEATGAVAEDVLRGVEKEQDDVDVTEGTVRWASARLCTTQRLYALRAAKCDRMAATGRVYSTPRRAVLGRIKEKESYESGLRGRKS